MNEVTPKTSSSLLDTERHKRPAQSRSSGNMLGGWSILITNYIWKSTLFFFQYYNLSSNAIPFRIPFLMMLTRRQSFLFLKTPPTLTRLPSRMLWCSHFFFTQREVLGYIQLKSKSESLFSFRMMVADTDTINWELLMCWCWRPLYRYRNTL